MQVGLPLGSFAAAVLAIIPLPAHVKARNVATIAISIWLFVANLAQGINTLAWANNIEIKLVVWCDIVTRLFIGSNLALSAACFALCMHLERIASARMVQITEADKRKRMLVDSVLCFGLPAVYMSLYYVVQGHRFDIVENLGCRPETYVSIPEFFLIRFPPILLSVATLVYAALAFTHFFRRRATFAKHLRSNSSALTPSRYFRLMAMALVEMFWGLFITTLNTWFSYRDGLRPWISWSNTHSDFSRIGQFPAVLIPQQTLVMTYLLWWAVPVSAYLFFIFFAFGQDTAQSYVACWEWIRRFLPRWMRPRPSNGKVKVLASLPVFRPSPVSPSDSTTFVKTSFSDDSLRTPTRPDAEKGPSVWNDSPPSFRTSFTPYSVPWNSSLPSYSSHPAPSASNGYRPKHCTSMHAPLPLTPPPCAYPPS